MERLRILCDNLPSRYNYLHDKPFSLLIGNKCDLEDDQKVLLQQARNMADNLDIESDNIFEISAKTGIGYDKIFAYLVQKLGSVEEGRSVSVRIGGSRFKIEDRVSVHDKHGIAHHGTVCKTGVKKQKDMCVEIQMVISYICVYCSQYS
jgi:50S ribosomal subunit-associated GTPase HflX